ncbi:MAG: leucine-rich repeat domain-containing protein, partial [Rikenellaceae bacterium]|nr:leucine-rich repeat domain-containing protein [Rikenellaceae bacterium]
MKKLSVFALAALAFAACTTPTPENTPDPVMTVDATEYAAGVAEEEFVFNIESNIDWTVTSEADWLEIMPAEGKGNSAVYVTIAANEAYDPREAVVTVAAVKPEAAAVVGEHTITIKQDEAKALVIGKSRFNVAAEASTVTIELSTNVEYTVAFSADWLSEASDATRGLENKTIVVAVAENTEYDDREGTITITSELGEDVVKITQEQKRAVVLGATSFDVAAEGGVIEVPLKRNMSYRASTSVDWITRARETRALEDDVVKFEVAANEGLARTGYIYFETDESTDSVAVNQAKSTQAIVKIADSRFSKFLIDNFDTNDDAEMSVAELEAITELNFSKCPTSTYIWSSVNVTNFSGIEYMINLETLNVVNSKATSIDLSNNTKLTSVTIVDTKITSLDVSALTELTYLNVGATPITSLDLSNNTKLTYLCVSGDALAELNVSALTELTVLDCAYNKLTSLDVSKNTKLEGLYCNGNKLTELNVAGLAALGRLNCDHNQIAALDVTANSNLTVLNCGRNKLTSLKVAGLGNLTILSAPHNMTLTSLDLSGLSKLRSLTLPKTGITTLSTAACPELVQVNVNESPNLASLDISASTKITGLVVDGTALTTLDVSKQPKLGSLLAKDPQNTSVTTTPLESIT